MLLDFDAVTKRYEDDGARPVLDAVSFALAAGVTLAVTGESGSGKSTLLNLAAGLDRADGGTVRIDGDDLGAMDDPDLARLRRRRVGLVFQTYNLIPSLSVAENLAFHARLGGRHDPAWVQTIADRLGIADLGARYPEQISGGQAQRVAIGRTLAAWPDLILADEPTGNLDEAAAGTVLSLMTEMARQTGAGLLLVTHSDRLADQLDRRLHLSLGALTEPACRQRPAG